MLTVIKMSKTLLLTTKDIDQVSSLLLKGEVVGFPTETVYGLGVVYDDNQAFEKLMLAKNRPENKPFTLMCCSLRMIEEYVVIDDKIRKLIHRFMPGALTLIVKSRPDIPYHVTLGSDYVGVRISEHPFVLDLIRNVNKPLLVPSANKSGNPSLTKYTDVYKEFNNEIAALIKEDALNDLPSTIIKVEGDKLICIRTGSLAFEEIEDYWRNI